MATEISKSVLIQYLDDVLELEENCLQQEKLYKSLGDLVSQYSNDEPSVQLPPGPTHNGKVYYAIAGLLAVLGIAIIAGAYFKKNYVLLIPLILIIVGTVKCVKWGKKQDKEYNAEFEVYRQAKQAQKEQENRWELNCQIQNYYRVQQSCVVKKYTETRELLDELYETNIIYPLPKYRGIIPVSEFSDYIKSGACNNMPEAYNKYDLMSRLDKICTQLDQIIDNLEGIRKQQYSLYCILRSVQDTNERLLNSVQYYGDQLHQELSRQNELITDFRGSVDKMNDINKRMVENTELVNRNVELHRKEDEFRYRMKRLYNIG